MKRLAFLLSFFISDLYASNVEFDKASIIASENARTEEGKKYDRSLAIFLQTSGTELMNACFSEIENPSLVNFVIVIKVKSSGVIDKYHLDNVTNISNCFAEKLGVKALPSPPKDLFWAKIEMDFGD